MLWEDGPVDLRTVPPGELDAGATLEAQYPDGERAEQVAALIDDARELLAGHPLNRERLAREQAPLDLLWPWGFGGRPTCHCSCSGPASWRRC